MAAGGGGPFPSPGWCTCSGFLPWQMLFTFSKLLSGLGCPGATSAEGREEASSAAFPRPAAAAAAAAAASEFLSSTLGASPTFSELLTHPMAPYRIRATHFRPGAVQGRGLTAKFHPFTTFKETGFSFCADAFPFLFRDIYYDLLKGHLKRNHGLS